MRKTLTVLLAASAVSAFAQVGDVVNYSGAKDNIIELYLDSSATILDMLDNPYRTSQLKNFTIRNYNFKLLKNNFSNANVAIFDIMTRYTNQELPNGTGYEAQVIFDDQNQLAPVQTHFVPHSKNTWIPGMAIEKDDVETNKVSKGLELVKTATSDSVNLTEVIIEKTAGVTNAVGYTYVLSPVSNPKSTDKNCYAYKYFPQSGDFYKAPSTQLLCFRNI